MLPGQAARISLGKGILSLNPSNLFGKTPCFVGRIVPFFLQKTGKTGADGSLDAGGVQTQARQQRGLVAVVDEMVG